MRFEWVRKTTIYRRFTVSRKPKEVSRPPSDFTLFRGFEISAKTRSSNCKIGEISKVPGLFRNSETNGQLEGTPEADLKNRTVPAKTRRVATLSMAVMAPINFNKFHLLFTLIHFKNFIRLVQAEKKFNLAHFLLH